MGTSKDVCISALREAAEVAGPELTKAEYESLGYRPSSATIIRTFGSWNEAKAAAGLSINPNHGPRVQPKPENVEVSVETPWEELSVDQRWYYKNAQEHNRAELRRRSNLREKIREFKRGSDGCRNCEETAPECLDFHHPNPAEKSESVNKMVPQGYGWEAIKKEIGKCVLLCANCHRQLHTQKASPEKPIQHQDFVDNPDFGLSLWPGTCEGRFGWSWHYRRTLGCQMCDMQDPRCLQFHHTDRAEKHESVGAMVRRNATRPDIVREAKKCEVLCANCHRKEHSSP